MRQSRQLPLAGGDAVSNNMMPKIAEKSPMRQLVPVLL
jgi:hypothetical protein